MADDSPASLLHRARLNRRPRNEGWHLSNLHPPMAIQSQFAWPSHLSSTTEKLNPDPMVTRPTSTKLADPDPSSDCSKNGNCMLSGPAAVQAGCSPGARARQLLQAAAPLSRRAEGLPQQFLPADGAMGCTQQPNSTTTAAAGRAAALLSSVTAAGVAAAAQRRAHLPAQPAVPPELYLILRLKQAYA